MMSLFKRALDAIDTLSGLMLFIAVAINAAAVFMRYVMNDSISWSEEGIRYISVWMTFFGAASASWLDEHLDMNLFTEYAGPFFLAVQKAALHALTAVFAVFVLWQGVIYVWLNGSQTAPTTGLEMRYVYSAIAIGGFLLLAVSLVKFCCSIVMALEARRSRNAAL